VSGAAEGAGPVRAIWRWNVMHSPLARRIRANRYAARQLAAAGLPASVSTRIDAIVRRTRLWADERGDVARELIAHARDATDAGRTEPEILSSLGDPKPVARLIRRAMKRKRSWLYQTRAWAARGLGVACVLVMVGYGVLALRFYTGRAHIETNYLAMLNDRIAEYGPDERGYPVYQDVGRRWWTIAERLRAESVYADTPSDGDRGIDMLPDLDPSHPDYDAVASAVRGFRPELDRVADATARPVMGFRYSDRMNEESDADGYYAMEPLEPNANPEDQGYLFEVLLPHLGQARGLTRLMVFDTRLAADEGDAARVERTITALADLSRQLGCEPFLISSLVGVAVHNLAGLEVARVLDDHPGLLDGPACTRLAHAFARVRPDAVHLEVVSEAYIFDDLLQRTYTDDGHGNGRLTPAGIELLREFASPPDDLGVVPMLDQTPLTDAAAPAALLVAPDRRSLANRQGRMLRKVEEVLDVGPERLGELRRVQIEVTENQNGVFDPVGIMIPAYDRALATLFRERAHDDAVRVILAVEAFVAEHGRLPVTLHELTPTYLPEIPPDPFDPGSSIKYRALEGGGYTVYFAGADGDDDGGTPPIEDDGDHADAHIRVADLLDRFGRLTPDEDDAPTTTYSMIGGTQDPHAPVPNGDWVLYPPPPSE